MSNDLVLVGNAWVAKIDIELGLHKVPDYAERVRKLMSNLSNEDLVKLGEKYIPGQDGRGTLTFLIEETLKRLKE